MLRELSVLSVVALLAGCAVEHASADDDAEPAAANDATDEAVTKKLPAPSLSQRLYFPNAKASSSGELPYLGGSKAWPYPAAGEHEVTSYWTFDAKGGSSFSVSVSGLDDGEGIHAPLTLSVYYLYKGKWRRADSTKGKGSVSISFAPKYDHQWLIAASGDVFTDENNLEIALGCTSGADASGHSTCAVAEQPGDACGGIAAAKFVCDRGLYCDYGATCGAGDVQGHCAIAPASCAWNKGTPAPVCGCDGKTYDSECDAQAASVSIASAGACGGGCTWTGAKASVASLATSTWKTDDGVVTYAFSASDNTVSSTYDVCARSTCKVAVRSKTGHVYTKGANVVLAYDDGTSVNLVLQTGCGGTRLDGDDWGRHVDASPSK